MLPELGLISLIVAFFFNVLIVVFLINSYSSPFDINLIEKEIYFSFAVFIFIFFAILVLVCSFFLDDFSVLYVYSNSNSRLSLIYKLSAVWGAHEGSFLLLVFIFSLFIFIFSLFKLNICYKFFIVNRIILYTLLLIFLLLLIFISNPFLRISGNIPIDGMDLNPLLQDIGLIIHPPLLYIGYICFIFPFSLSLSILLLGKYKVYYFRYIYIWVLFALFFLTLGILLGSWWAYYELGWGGYWFWDPVENASLIPWISGVILLHLLILSRVRFSYYKIVLFFSLLTFLFCLLSIFLVRSGIINSVHSFALSDNRKLYFFLYFFFIFLFSIVVYFLRYNIFSSTNFVIGFFYKDIFLIIFIFFFVLVLLTILVGTFYPYIINIFFDIDLSVGTNYFNTTVVPIILLSFFFIPFAFIFKWNNNNNYYITILLLLFSFLSILFLFGTCKIDLSIYFFLVLFTIFFITFSLILYLVFGLFNFNKFITFTSHFSLIFIIFGIYFSSIFSVEKDIILSVGEKVSINNHDFIFKRILKKNGQNYLSYVGEFLIKKNNQIVFKTYPERRMFYISGLTMVEASIKTKCFIDFYLALGNIIDNGKWGIRIYYKPFVFFIWFGGFLCFLSFFVRAFMCFFKYFKY